MKPHARSGLLAHLQSAAAMLARDKRGNAAIEFAVIVPLMLAMFFGTVEFSSAVAVNRKISLVSQELADLVSRYANVSDTDITNFNMIAKAMMTPYSATPLIATMSELYIDPATGAARVQWSKGDAPRGIGSSVTVPADLIAKDASNKIFPGQYLIFTEAHYLYVPAVGQVMGKAGVTLSDKIYMRPRQSTCVLYAVTSGNCPTS